MTSDPLPTVSKTRPSKRRTTLLISALLIGFGLLGWEYWNLRCHHASLARLQSELERRRIVQTKLRRDEVDALLTGFPRKRSEPGVEARTDYYTWRGIIHDFHICVKSTTTEEVVQADNSPFAGGDPTGKVATPVAQSRSMPAATVDAGLEKAEQIFSQFGATNEFREALRSVFDGLPEAKLSTEKGQLSWNSFKFPRRERRLFAVRFSSPSKPPLDLDFVLWRNSSSLFGIVPEADGLLETADYQRIDVESNVQAAGVELPGKNTVRFGTVSLRKFSPRNNFILWFFVTDDKPIADFESKFLLFATAAEKSPNRFGLHEISDHIGLRTNVPKFAPTADGVRDALKTLDIRLAYNFIDPSTFGRLLRPVMPALPEVKVSTTPGQALWQPIDFSNGPCAAVRIRIPELSGKKADLYGALLETRPSQFGWDRGDTPLGAFHPRTVLDARLSEPDLPPPNRLTLFAHPYGLLKSGDEFTLWIRQLEQPPGPVFVTLMVLPHDDDLDDTLRIYAYKAWSCGKLLGVDVPAPRAPEGCAVLGWHEIPITHLLFTPDSRRLVSIDTLHHVRIYNVESRQLEGQIDLPYLASGTVILDRESQTLLAFDRAQKSVQRWNLDTREKSSTLDIHWRQNETLEAAAFGPQANQLVAVPMSMESTGRGWFQYQPRFTMHDLKADRVTEHLIGAPGKISSMIFLSALNMFAVGCSRVTADFEKQTARSITSVQLWPPDLSSPIQELPLSDLPIEHTGHGANAVRLSQSAGGRRMAAICQRGHLKVWDTATLTELLSTPTTAPLLTVSISPDGEQVAATVEKSDAVSVWTVSDGQQRQLWQTDDIPITHVTHSPDGRWVATTNTDGVIRLWVNSK